MLYRTDTLCCPTTLIDYTVDPLCQQYSVQTFRPCLQGPAHLCPSASLVSFIPIVLLPPCSAGGGSFCIPSVQSVHL